MKAITPAPWRVYDHTNHVVDADSINIAEVQTVGRHDEWQRNAALIAAAPELLEALTALYEETLGYIVINHLGAMHHNRAMQLAKAAITKAEQVLVGE